MGNFTIFILFFLLIIIITILKRCKRKQIYGGKEALISLLRKYYNTEYNILVREREIVGDQFDLNNVNYPINITTYTEGTIQTIYNELPFFENVIDLKKNTVTTVSCLNIIQQHPTLVKLLDVLYRIYPDKGKAVSEDEFTVNKSTQHNDERTAYVMFLNSLLYNVDNEDFGTELSLKIGCKLQLMLYKKDISKMKDNDFRVIKLIILYLLEYDVDLPFFGIVKNVDDTAPNAIISNYKNEFRDVMNYHKKTYLAKNPYKQKIKDLYKRVENTYKNFVKDKVDFNYIMMLSCLKNRIHNNILEL